MEKIDLLGGLRSAVGNSAVGPEFNVNDPSSYDKMYFNRNTNKTGIDQ